jgi:ArsR family transcriptional regulator
MTQMELGCAERLKTLADGTRLAVLGQLLGGERRVGEMQRSLNIDQSLLSHHLRVLRDADMVVARRVGKAVAYRLAPGVAPTSGGEALDLGCCQLSFPKGHTK